MAESDYLNLSANCVSLNRVCGINKLTNCRIFLHITTITAGNTMGLASSAVSTSRNRIKVEVVVTALTAWQTMWASNTDLPQNVLEVIVAHGERIHF
jgi:hypothetical protein